MTPCLLPVWGEDTGFFVPEDAWVGMLAQLRVHATRGSAPSAALGRLEDGAPASRDRLRSFVVSLRGEGERKHWVFVSEDARFWAAVRAGFRSGGIDGGMLVQLRVHATRGSAPSSAPGGASRTEPPLRVTASAVEITSLPCCITAENASLEQPLRELMTFVMGRS